MNKLELTPAESYLLLDIENKDGKTLMKYSLINLLYKNVISYEVREETEGTVFKQVVKKTYLSKGSQFGKLNLKAHEKLLCSVMADEEDEIELVEFIKKQNGLAKIKDNKLIIKRDWKKNSDKFKGAFSIARELAEIAAYYENNSPTKS